MADPETTPGQDTRPDARSGTRSGRDEPGASATEVVVERRVEWSDTDASGHQHNTAVIRWAEAAEAELLRRHDLASLWGRAPRVRHEINYRGRLWHGQPVRIRLRVAELGRTSLTYAFEVHGPSGLAADGRVVIAHAAPDAPSATPWPQAVRDTFAEVARPATADSALEVS
ncbi:acyl-CoA thioesterase [Streptomyces sp. NPDC055078]